MEKTIIPVLINHQVDQHTPMACVVISWQFAVAAGSSASGN